MVGSYDTLLGSNWYFLKNECNHWNRRLAMRSWHGPCLDKSLPGWGNSWKLGKRNPLSNSYRLRARISNHYPNMKMGRFMLQAELARIVFKIENLSKITVKEKKKKAFQFSKTISLKKLHSKMSNTIRVATELLKTPNTQNKRNG